MIQQKINILLVDDHTMVTEGMRTILANLLFSGVIITASNSAEALKLLTDGTGGRIFSIDNDVKDSVKAICDELRNNRYQLTYYPEGINPINKRHLLVTSFDAGIHVRLKGFHPPHRF